MRWGQGDRWDCPLNSLWHLFHLGGGYTVASNSMSVPILDLRFGLLCASNAQGNADRWGTHVIPEVGYSGLFPASDKEGPKPPTTHLATLGVGLGGGNRWVSLTYNPRILVGSQGEGGALGLRHGPVLRLLHEFLSAEVSHQILWTGSGVRQDLVVMGSVNVLVLGVALAYTR